MVDHLKTQIKNVKGQISEAQYKIDHIQEANMKEHKGIERKIEQANTELKQLYKKYKNEAGDNYVEFIDRVQIKEQQVKNLEKEIKVLKKL